MFRKLLVLLFLLVVPCIAGESRTGFGEVRYLPRGWTAPKVVKNGGNTYIVPSRPILRKYEVGTRSESRATVHREDAAPPAGRSGESVGTAPPPATTVTINLGGGLKVTLEPGQEFEVKGKRYLLMAVTDEHAVFKEVESGRIFNRKLK